MSVCTCYTCVVQFSRHVPYPQTYICITPRDPLFSRDFRERLIKHEFKITVDLERNVLNLLNRKKTANKSRNAVDLPVPFKNYTVYIYVTIFISCIQFSSAM